MKNLEIEKEFLDQLESDILHFRWLCQTAEEVSDHPHSETQSIVLSTVLRMVEGEKIVVGEAKAVNEMTLIFPFSEKGALLLEKLQTLIRESRDGWDRDFCFWIQLTKHYNK
ncbi:hypothetical protein P3T73_13075 [Kiritimatiellota bacterium B12222]|nr:hypothetical protein P3T73_13075 [Kiritimatiellota bacterium B12222]